MLLCQKLRLTEFGRREWNHASARSACSWHLWRCNHQIILKSELIDLQVFYLKKTFRSWKSLFDCWFWWFRGRHGRLFHLHGRRRPRTLKAPKSNLRISERPPTKQRPNRGSLTVFTKVSGETKKIMLRQTLAAYVTLRAFISRGECDIEALRVA